MTGRKDAKSKAHNAPAEKSYSAYGVPLNDALRQMFTAGNMPIGAKVPKGFMRARSRKTKYRMA